MWIWFLAIAAAYVFAVCIVVLIAYNEAFTRKKENPDGFERTKKPLPPDKQACNEQCRIDSARAAALPSEVITITAFDGIQLVANLYTPTEPSDFVAILVHGFHASGLENFASMMPFYLNDLHCNVLLIDQRAHGRSGGKVITFGALEHKDVLMWAQTMVERFGENCKIVLHGISMGAGTVMLANERKPPIQVKAIVEDCGYTSGFEQIKRTMRQEHHIRLPGVMLALECYLRVRGGFSLKNDTKCLQNMPWAHCSMVFIHGREDTFVPFEMGERLYAACGRPKTKLWVPDAAHAMCYFVAEQDYQQAIRALLARTETSPQDGQLNLSSTICPS
ncbi:MAG: alpha/beta hydrolase [Oscillospiraceae bacterium]|jgi:fermentation-respiration switch protein FrsA (DUF1100 family)|nr:alpha/beta hydrolase [Oscillospiraceae bacterium]